MIDLTRDVAKAVHNRLSTDVGILSILGDPARLYDSAPEDPVFPYLTYGPMRSEDEGGDNVPPDPPYHDPACVVTL